MLDSVTGKLLSMIRLAWLGMGIYLSTVNFLKSEYRSNISNRKLEK